MWRHRLDRIAMRNSAGRAWRGAMIALRSIGYNPHMLDSGTDPLSSLAHEIINASTYEKLVAPSHALSPSHELLAGATPNQLLMEPVTNWPAAMAMLAGLWLWHDGLSECHEIVQKSPEELERAAHFSRSKPTKTSQYVPLVQSVENHKDPKNQQVQEMTATLSFWHILRCFRWFR